MRSPADLPAVPWRGVVAFVLDNVLPLLGFAAVVIGAFQLPGVYGSVGGWVAMGAALVWTRHLISEDVEALKAQAKADRVDRERARVTARRMQAVA
jgi:hypothetical protein